MITGDGQVLLNRSLANWPRDIFRNPYTPELKQILGKPIVVVNKAGAGGQVGWTDMARQKPDGYFLGYINLPATNTVVLDAERKAIFGIDAFVPIINQVLDPGVVWVRADSPYKTMQDLVSAAKKAPNTIRTGSER